MRSFWRNQVMKVAIDLQRLADRLKYLLADYVSLGILQQQ
jgi:hypothetical protein